MKFLGAPSIPRVRQGWRPPWHSSAKYLETEAPVMSYAKSLQERRLKMRRQIAVLFGVLFVLVVFCFCLCIFLLVILLFSHICSLDIQLFAFFSLVCFYGYFCTCLSNNSFRNTDSSICFSKYLSNNSIIPSFTFI